MLHPIRSLKSHAARYLRGLQRRYEAVSAAGELRGSLGRLEEHGVGHDRALEEARRDLVALGSACEQELATLRADVVSLTPLLLGGLARIETHLEADGQALAALVSSQELEASELRSALAELRETQLKQFQLAKGEHDELPALRAKLRAFRSSETYSAAFNEKHPLISVAIATYNRAALLVERAISSVQAQTYDHWEVVVVGDGCTDDTAARVEALGDPRIRFSNLPFRTVEANSETQRYIVSGAAPYNRAVELCRGTWVVPLDDDDELLPTHMEKLLKLALERRAEFVYGKLLQVAGPEDTGHLFSFPPEYGQVGMQQTMYLRGLDFIECDLYSWMAEEPVDVNFIRRMRVVGVTMAATEEEVARYYPSRFYPSAQNPP